MNLILKRARGENRFREVMVFADVEDDVASQLHQYRNPIAGAKAKPKAKPAAQAGGRGSTSMAAGYGGAMTVASKRRWEDDLMSMAASEGWEDIGVLASHEEVERSLAEQGCYP